MQRRALKDIALSCLDKIFVREAGRIPLSYNVKIEARHADGKVFATRDISNLIMDAGEDEVAKLLCGVEATAFDYIALGTGDTAADDAQTALVAEISSNGGSRAQDASTSVTANVATIEYQFSITDALAIKESGVFNDPSAGDMLCRQTFDVINVGNGDTVTVTWQITVGVAR